MRGLIVDSNLLLLYTIGTFDTRMIPTFKRTAKYSAEDFQRVAWLVNICGDILTTPSILTEVSNLSTKPAGRLRVPYFQSFAVHIRGMRERLVSSTLTINIDSFAQFGFSDAAIHEFSSKGHLVLTDDLQLAVYLASRNIEVINFNHLRAA